MEIKRKKGVAPPRCDDAFKAGSIRMVTEQGHPSTEVSPYLIRIQHTAGGDFARKLTCLRFNRKGGSLMRYYVTADIHGFYTPLIAALTKAGFFADSAPHKLVILGDLFARGREALKLQAFLSALLDQDKVILVRGNHEDLFEELVTIDTGLPYRHHVDNGTYDTALQLTGFDPHLAPTLHDDFAEAARNTVFYQKIIPAMLDYFETEHHIFVHGWIPCIQERNGYSSIGDWRNASADLWEKARWINGMAAFRYAYEDDKTIICGHWHTSFGHSTIDHAGSQFGSDANFRPFYGTGIIALDACTAVSGFVNCIVVES